MMLTIPHHDGNLNGIVVAATQTHASYVFTPTSTCTARNLNLEDDSSWICNVVPG